MNIIFYNMKQVTPYEGKKSKGHDFGFIASTLSDQSVCVYVTKP